MSSLLKEIAINGTPQEKRELFKFEHEPVEEILLKFNLWSRSLLPDYFESKDAPFHNDINTLNSLAYVGDIDTFVDIAFRGAGKDVKTKLFIAFCILNDSLRRRRYFKILSADLKNAKQSVTDIYNIFVNPMVSLVYPNTFEKSHFKHEEQMGAFTTAFGVKVVADTVGSEQRGNIQEFTRPDFIWFNDFETRKTLRSAVITKSIWDNMEEARTGLQKDGCCVYTCNYLSKRGNVHKLVGKEDGNRKRVLIVPIITNVVEADKKIVSGDIAWDRYSLEDVKAMQADDEDFAGERLCKPSSVVDAIFSQEMLDKMEKLPPVEVIADFKIFKKFQHGRRYGSGHDVAGGVNLDHSTSVFIDFDTVPANVVATFKSNTVKPEAFGSEVYRESKIFGLPISAIENNKFDQAVLKAKDLGCFLYAQEKAGTSIGYREPSAFGWNTNTLTKPKMFFDLADAVEKGLLVFNDEDLIQEAEEYSRNDLIDKPEDARLISTPTRHFDLLTACAIAWQMRNHARVPNNAPRVTYHA